MQGRNQWINSFRLIDDNDVAEEMTIEIEYAAFQFLYLSDLTFCQFRRWFQDGVINFLNNFLNFRNFFRFPQNFPNFPENFLKI